MAQCASAVAALKEIRANSPLSSSHTMLGLSLKTRKVVMGYLPSKGLSDLLQLRKILEAIQLHEMFCRQIREVEHVKSL
jgi:hypothetical protein